MERECKNCGQVLYAQHDFCFRCGAKWIDYRLTPKAVIQEVSNRYLGIDNKFLRTMVALVTHPHHVIDGYMQGVRRKFINPINFYLIGLTLIGVQIFFIKNFTEQSLIGNADGAPEALMNVMDKMFDYIGLIGTVNLPIYALVGYLIYRNCKRYNFTEHLILSVYVFGFYNIYASILTVIGVYLGGDFGIMSIVLSPLPFLHMFYAYHKIFEISLQRTLLKAIFYVMLSGITYAIVIIIISILFALIVTQFFPEFIESFKIKN